MAEEYFQGEVCGGNWWNSSRDIFGSSPCSSIINEIANFECPNDMIMDMNTTSNDDSSSPSDGSIVLQDVQKPQQPDSEFITEAKANISIGSTLQMMGFEISSSTPDHWNQDIFHESGRISQGNCAHILQENLNSSINYLPQTGVSFPQIQKDWNSKNWGQDSSINTSSLLKFLFDTDSHDPHNSSLENQAMNYQSPTSYQMNEFAPYLPQFSPLIKPSLPNKQPANHLRFYNNTPLLNVKAASVNDIPASLLHSTQSQFPPSNINEKPNLRKGVHRETQGLSSVARKTSSEPALKRSRIETPSPLPTIKVRKEKLGDRITVLQQLVAPFGKTDTASVLHEAIGCIKFLHDQVSVLSSAYMKNGSSVEHQQAADKFSAKGESNQDLKSRGLCLVPISSTFPVAAETATDFWTPTFGGTFR